MDSMLCPEVAEEVQGLAPNHFQIVVSFRELFSSRGITQVSATFLAIEDQYQRSGSNGTTDHSREAGVVRC